MKLRLIEARPCAKLLCGGVLAILCAACSLMQPSFVRPQVTVSSVALRSGNLLSQEFAVKLHVDNPNNQALPVEGLHIELRAAGDPIASGDSDRAFRVPAHGSSDFDMTIKANLGLALLKLGDALNRNADSMPYDLDGTARLGLPFLRELPFRQAGVMPLQGFR